MFSLLFLFLVSNYFVHCLCGSHLLFLTIVFLAPRGCFPSCSLFPMANNSFPCCVQVSLAKKEIESDSELNELKLQDWVSIIMSKCMSSFRVLMFLDLSNLEFTGKLGDSMKLQHWFHPQFPKLSFGRP